MRGDGGQRHGRRLPAGPQPHPHAADADHAAGSLEVGEGHSHGRASLWHRFRRGIVFSAMKDAFDVICIGTGTVAEAIASTTAGSGIRLAVVEKELVGGECAYWGCMPSKTLLRSAEVIAEAGRARELAASRIEWQVDFAKVSRRAHWMARELDDSGATRSIQANGATVVRGVARLVGPRTVVVGDRTLTAKLGVVIATGTVPSIPPVPGLRELDVWTNREAVMADTLPPRLLVIGGGPIGVELAQAYARLGSAVTVVEAADRLLPGDDPRAGALLAGYLEADGITLRTGATVAAASRTGGEFRLVLGSGEELRGERLLVAAGRRPQLDGIDLAAAGAGRNEAGWVRVDPHTLEAGDGIWAGGDVTGIGAFTHLAWYHGTIIGRRLQGAPDVADHRALPRVTFTDPEVASVGLSEERAREELRDVRTVVADVGESGRGYINGEPGGMIKLVADGERGVLAGATVVSPRGGEILSELTLAIRAAVPLTVLADTMHAFPTFSRILDGMFPRLLGPPPGP